MAETIATMPRLTEEASAKAYELLTREGREDLRLRLQVSPGGCSGLIYGLFFDDRVLEGDTVIDSQEVELVIDRMTLPYVDGATISYADTLEKQGFSITNPTAARSCACGDSFY